MGSGMRARAGERGFMPSYADPISMRVKIGSQAKKKKGKWNGGSNRETKENSKELISGP